MGLKTEQQEVETERQELLKECQEQYSDFEERFAKSGYGMHELVDRASVIMDMWYGYILEHPSCAAHQEWFELAYEISEKMHDFYQKTALFEDEKEL